MNIIKAIINDFKTDFKFISKVFSGEYKFPYTLKEVLDIRPMFKDAQTWIFFLIIIVALLTGSFMSAKYYQFQANEEIIKAKEFVNEQCTGINSSIKPLETLNFTKLIKEIEKTSG